MLKLVTESIVTKILVISVSVQMIVTATSVKQTRKIVFRMILFQEFCNSIGTNVGR